MVICRLYICTFQIANLPPFPPPFLNCTLFQKYNPKQRILKPFPKDMAVSLSLKVFVHQQGGLPHWNENPLA